MPIGPAPSTGQNGAVALRLLPALLGLALATSCSEQGGPGGSEAPRAQREPATVLRPHSPPRFRARREWNVGGKPEHLLAADLDGDGSAELAATLIDRPALLLWSGTEEGLDRAPRELAVGGWPLRPIALAPGAFGAPAGRRLVAIASRAERSLVLHDLAGDAQPRELWRGPTPRAMAHGDLGADGSWELALATDGRELAIVGADGSVRTVALAHDLPRCVLVLANGAGVVVGFQDSRTLEVIAPGSSEPPVVLQLDGIPRDLIEVDLDRDGQLELVAVGGDGDAWVFEQDHSPAGRLELGSIPIDVEAADLDGDGALELALLAHLGLSYELATGRGEGGLERMARGYAGQTPTSLALADFDGDGAVDLAVANRDSRSIGLLRGDGHGGVVDAIQVSVGGAPNAVALGDLAGDALPEIVVLNSKSETLTVLARAGDGYVPLARHGLGGAPVAVALADLEGDARPEIAVLTGATGGSRVELYGLSGGAVVFLAAHPVGARGEDLAAVDSDGDGRPELWVAAPDAGQVIQLSAGVRVAFPVPSAPCALAAIEFDGDRAPELAVALGPPGPRKGVAVLDLLPDGRVVEIGVVETAGWPVDVVACELDGDGALDLAVLSLEGRSARGLVQPLRCELGRALLPRRAHATGLRPGAIAAGDLDGDGRDDLLVAAQSGHVINAWLAIGADGELDLERIDDIGAHLGCLDVAVDDLDGDGLLDLVVANGFSDDVSAVFSEPR